MAGILREAMQAGTIGLASSTNEQHLGHGGVPIPSRLADEREFRALMSAMAPAFSC